MIPVITSLFIVGKSLSLNILGNLQFLAIVAITILTIVFFVIVIFALKFFNLEVPNNEVAWSYKLNRGGIYFKVLLKILLCSQEL